MSVRVRLAAELLSAVDTIVIVMGLTSSRRRSCRGLLESGCDPQKPVALIESGTLEAQRTLHGTVAQIDALAQHWEFRPPATVIVVGEVVRLGQELQWLRSRKCRPLKSDGLVDIT